jgi:signal-transduction protein with cAMP-binding, CBS, and nucleotidyltransferase domain
VKVADLCRRSVVSISAAAPVIDAARLMCSHGIGAIVVTRSPAESAIAVGIVTDRDIVLAQLAGTRDLGQLCVAEVMTGDPLVLNEEDPIDVAIHRMRSRGVRRAPVAGRAGVLTGVISFDDMLAHVSMNVAALARLTSHPRQSAEPRVV